MEFDFNENVEFETGGEQFTLPGEKPDEKEIEVVKGKTIKEEEEEEEEVINDKPIIEEKKNTPSPSDIEKETSQKEKNTVSVLASYYKEEGLISDYDETEMERIISEEGESAGLKYLADIQRDEAFKEAREMYDADMQEYMNLKDLGVDSSVAKGLVSNKTRFESLTVDDIENDEDVRKEILFQHYKNTTTFSDAKIKRDIDKTFASGDDIEEATEALEEVKVNIAKQIEAEISRIKQNDLDQKNNVVRQKEEFKKYVNDLEEIIPGEKLNKKTRDKIIDMVLKPAVKLENGQVVNAIWGERAKDTKKFESAIAYHILNGTLYGETEKSKAKVKTAAAKEVDRVFNTKSTSLKGKPTKLGEEFAQDWQFAAKELGAI
jgi:3-methyladenine DNA glycosylase Tag